MNILSLFSPTRPELTIREIAQLTELPYPSVWRLCYTMEQCGYLMTLPDSGKVCPSARALSLGHTVVSRYPVAEVIYPRMQAMTERYKVSLSLGARIGTEMVYLRRTYAGFVTLMRSSMPIPGAPTGWALLAALTPAEREALLEQVRLAYPEHWSEFRERFNVAVAGYEHTGYVVIPDIVKVHADSRNVVAPCIAVPIRSGSGNQILGLSCTGTPKVLSEELYEEVGNALLKISRTMTPGHM